MGEDTWCFEPEKSVSEWVYISWLFKTQLKTCGPWTVVEQSESKGFTFDSQIGMNIKTQETVQTFSTVDGQNPANQLIWQLYD